MLAQVEKQGMIRIELPTAVFIELWEQFREEPAAIKFQTMTQVQRMDAAGSIEEVLSLLSHTVDTHFFFFSCCELDGEFDLRWGIAAGIDEVLFA